MAKTVDERFDEKWEAITETGCHIWTASVDRDGYGSFDGGKAHRHAWVRANGPIPKGLFVCHRCDIPPCVNNKHLFIGTSKDNSIDCQNKGRKSKGENHSKIMKARQLIGEKNGRCKLKDDDIIKIRKMAADGMPQYDIAIAFDISQTNVSYIALRKSWKHIP